MLNAYYLIEKGQQTGPFTHHELMDRGPGAEDLVLSPFTNQWDRAAAMFEFADYFESRGVYYPTRTALPNFWWRLLAYIIDDFLFYLTMVFFRVILGLISLYTGGHLFDSGFDYDGSLGLKLCSVLVFMLYHATCESTRLQGSIGKKVCQLKVVNASGTRISFATALGRNFGKILSSLVCGLGFFCVLWNQNRQGWHDQLAKTFVIRKP